MMTGYILNQHIIIRVPVRFSDGYYREIEFLLDSGFSGYMVLPLRDVAALKLPQALDTRANLADGSEILLPTYEAAILWHGAQRSVIVLATGDRPLIGTALLQGSALYAEFVDNGKVISLGSLIFLAKSKICFATYSTTRRLSVCMRNKPQLHWRYKVCKTSTIVLSPCKSRQKYAIRHTNKDKCLICQKK